jgi:hypothetical protein
MCYLENFYTRRNLVSSRLLAQRRRTCLIFLKITNILNIIMNFTVCILHRILLGWVGGICDKHGGGKVVYRSLVGRPGGKRPLGKPSRRWEDNIKMDLKVIGIDGANWIQLARDRVQWRACVYTVMNLRVP